MVLLHTGVVAHCFYLPYFVLNCVLKKVRSMTFVQKRSDKTKPISARDRRPMVSDTDINYILVSGAQLSLSKLKRGKSFDTRLYHFAEIGVFLEVSLSRGAGITDDTREQLQQIHKDAVHLYMAANKANHVRQSD